MNTKHIIDTYYQGWAKRDQDKVRSVVAANMTHSSPDGKYVGVDNFLSQCWAFGEGLIHVDYKKSVFTDDEAFVILEWQSENGSFINAEYVRLDSGKVKEILVITNSPDLAKSMS